MLKLQKFKSDKIQMGSTSRVSDKKIEETFRPLFYSYKDKLFNSISYDSIVCGINRISGKTRAPLGIKMINFYCAIAKSYPSND